MESFEDLRRPVSAEVEHVSTSTPVEREKLHPLITPLRRLQLIITFRLAIALAILCLVSLLFTQQWIILFFAAVILYGTWLATPYVAELEEQYGFYKRYLTFRDARRRGHNFTTALSGATGLLDLDDPYNSGIAARLAAPETDPAITVALPLPVRPRPSGYLNIAETLQPHVDLFFGARVGVFGLPGSGKSNTIAVILEELGLYGCPILVLDTENENAQLCTYEYFENPMRESAATVRPEKAFDFGRSIMESRLQVVLNLQSYKSDEEAAVVMINLCNGMNSWAEEQETRIPCAIVLDESHKWLPQQAGMSTLSKKKNADGFTILDYLKQCFLGTVASRGRKRGLSLIFATQRLALLNKNLIMCNWLFLLRQTLPNDLKTYAEMGCPANIAQGLQNGQACVISPDQVRQVHQIRMRYSESDAKTPGLENLEEYKMRSRSRSLDEFSPAPMDELSTPSREGVKTRLEPENVHSQGVNIPERSQASESAVNAISGEVKETILKAIIEMHASGVKVTRTGLRDHLKWNNRQYEQVLKPALDAMGLLM